LYDGEEVLNKSFIVEQEMNGSKNMKGNEKNEKVFLFLFLFQVTKVVVVASALVE
jgi:hypothetical protein